MDIKVILMMIASLIVILFPLGFAFVVSKKAYGKWSIVFLGAAGFIVGNFALNALISLVADGPVDNLRQSNELLANLIDCCQQGFVEEIMRFLLMLLCMKYSLQKENSLMYAAGHGGVEMMLAGVMNAVSTIQAFTNPEDSSLEEMPIFSPFIIPIAFIFIFCFQIGLSYLTFRIVKDKKYYLAFLPFLIHALGNFSSSIELPLVPLLGPLVTVIGLLIYTIISYKRDEKMDFFY